MALLHLQPRIDSRTSSSPCENGMVGRVDAHFEEDWCRVESKDVQQSLNMFRKAAINFIKNFKTRNNSKTAISNIMFECLMEPQMILNVIFEN